MSDKNTVYLITVYLIGGVQRQFYASYDNMWDIRILMTNRNKRERDKPAYSIYFNDGYIIDLMYEHVSMVDYAEATDYGEGVVDHVKENGFCRVAASYLMPNEKNTEVNL